MTDRTVVHATFDLERIYSAPRSRVFLAFADEPQKRQWAHGAPAQGYSLDFRVGGREHVEMSAPGGGSFRYDGIHYDIVENERIIYAYSFSFGQGNAGTTLTTVELADAEDGATLLKITEQGAYLDGFDGPKFWKSGTTSLLDRLNNHLEQKQ